MSTSVTAPGEHRFLPTTTAQTHAVNLLELPDGRLGAAWFGGTQEGLSDVCVWFATLGVDGWSDPVQVSDDPQCSEQNPVLFAPSSDEIWLLYTAQHAGNQDTACVRVRVSRDGGATWDSGGTLIPPGPDSAVFVRQPIVVTDSAWLLPVFCCVRPSSGRWVGDHDYSAVMVSHDRGRTWTQHRVPQSTGCVHMNVLALADRSYVAFFRRRQADSIFRSESRDGIEWTTPVATELPNNNSSIQAKLLDNGAIAMVYNASSAADATDRRTSLYDEIDDAGGLGETASDEESAPGVAFWGAPRAPLALALSYDGGQSWPIRRDIETGDGYCLTNNSRDGLNRELSYPAITQTADGAVHIAYTYFRQAIKHVRLQEPWIGHPSAGYSGRSSSPIGSME